MRTSLKATLVATIASSVALVACRKNEEEQPPQSAYQQPGYGQQQPGYGQQQPGYGQQQPGYGQPQPTATAYPTATTAPPATTAFPGTAAPSTGQAQPLDASMAGMAQQILNQMAATSAPPGAKPVGSALAGNFQAGQTLETQVQLQPGKCYTVVAAGLPPGVSEVNVQFVAAIPIPGMAPVLAQDNTSGAQAVLGPNPDCYKWPLPMGAPVKLILTVAGGSGMAAAQVYEK